KCHGEETDGILYLWYPMKSVMSESTKGSFDTKRLYNFFSSTLCQVKAGGDLAHIRNSVTPGQRV
ncbi:unnamed protein product, partial [Nesidiocoris tenuis]